MSLRHFILMLMYLYIRKKLEVKENPSLEAQENLEPQENQGVEEIETEELKPLGNTKDES